jgi:hypothetical protein
MIEIDNISFRVNSTFDGIGNYYIYNSSLCDISDFILSGTTNIVNGSSVVNINQPLLLNNNISIKFIDIKECNVCEDFELIVPTGETTTSTTTQQQCVNTEYTVKRCSDDQEFTFITAGLSLQINEVYIEAGSGNRNCYQILTFVGNTCDSVNTTLNSEPVGGFVYTLEPDPIQDGCSNNNCIQV